MDKLEDIEQKVQECKKCSLYKNRCKSVFGKGNKNAKIVVVGEAPGIENCTGLPFIGTSGKRLEGLFKKNGFNLKDIYFCNVVKCRPIKNYKDRKPNKQEVDACKEYLFAQIKIINPKAIILCGATASKTFGIKEPLNKVCKGYKKKDGMVLFPIYHPRSSITNKIKEDRLNEIQKCLKEKINV